MFAIAAGILIALLALFALFCLADRDTRPVGVWILLILGAVALFT